jgi:tetratricopeptide (TPR) repeat protein
VAGHDVPDRWLVPGLCVLLAGITWAVFGQTVHFDFVNYNDDIYVYDNPMVLKGLSLPGVGWAFTHPQVANWIPLTTLSHMLAGQLFGPHPGGHHLVNVLLHTAAALLLFLGLWQMTGRLWRSALVAAVFAVHPLRAESVAWVSERKDVLSAFLFMLTLGAYVRQVRRPFRGGPIVVFLLFALDLLAKSMVATLPLVLLLLDYWPLGRCQNRRDFFRRVVEKLPLLALSAGACVAAALVPGLVIPDAQRLPLLERLGNALVSCATYLRQMVWPAGLFIPYPYPHGPTDQPAGEVGLALVLVATISVWAVAGWKRRPWALVGWLWFLIMLAPVIEIIQINKDAARADRYTYLPGIGLTLAAIWAVAEGSAGWKHRRAVLSGLMVAVVAALTVVGRHQTAYWQNSETLWTHTLACTPDNLIARINLGTALAQEGKLEAAIGQYHKALEIKPDDVDARNNLGVTLFAKGEVAEAINQYRAVLETDPTNVVAHDNLGNALVKQGRLEEGIAQYQEVLDLNPSDANAHFNLGVALVTKGDLAGAITQYRLALESAPEQAETLNNLGLALLRTGDADGAMACFTQTTVMSPDPPARWYNLGNHLLQQGQLDEAMACYREALQIRPGYAGACAQLGTVYFQKGDMKPAIDFWQQALAADPNQWEVQNNLAWVLATARDPALRDGAKAVALAGQAAQTTDGGNPMILRTLAAAYAAAGRPSEAADTARKAAALALAQTNRALAENLRQELQFYETNARAQGSR